MKPGMPLICTLVILLAVSEPGVRASAADTDVAVDVVFTNGNRIRASSAVREGADWVLKMEGGTVRLAASQVREVRPADAAAAPAPAPIATAATPAPYTAARTTTEHRVQLGAFVCFVRLPAELAATAISEKDLATFSSPDAKRTVRVAWADTAESVWRLRAPTQAHHERVYTGYQTTAERFALLAGRQAWMLTFTCRNGEETWEECQGFIDLGDRTLVLSARAPLALKTTPELVVRSAGESLRLEEKSR